MVDVTVRGAGIFGLSVAYACARRGAKVRVIETEAIGAGSSGGLVGALAPHVPERWNDKKEFQFQSLMMAQDHWREVDGLSGTSSGYARLGRLQPVATGRGLTLARERAEQAATLWRGQAQWRLVDRAAVGDWAPESPTGWLIHDTLSARMCPRGAATSLARAIHELGAEIVIGDAAHEGAVVWATGVRGLEDLSKDLGRPVGGGIKGQSALLAYDARSQPQLFADALHIVPHEDGTVAIGSTSEREFADPASTDARLDDVLERATVAFPMLRGAKVLERWAGVRPRANSRAPMLGAWPERPGQFIANGGFKIGFGIAPKVGEAMADLVLEGRCTIPEGFRAEASL